MKKFLRVAALVVLIGGLVWFEVKWVSEADYENQKSRTAELLTEIAGEVSIIEVGLLEDGEIGEAKGRFDTALSSLNEIPYAAREKEDLLAELATYDEGLTDNAELAKELKILRSLCMGFAEKITSEYKEKTVSADLFKAINKEFLELAENLPEVKYEATQKLVTELKELINQVATSAAATANCVDTCEKATIETQKTALEQKLSDVTAKINVANDMIRDEFDSSGLTQRLHNI
ncbi:MAG: hypothetical protein ACK5MU_00115 [Candidatus Saccharimonadales bacterium]